MDRVRAVAEGMVEPTAEGIALSWRRCTEAYRIDPASNERPRILTHPELKEVREPMLGLIAHAQDELDLLYQVVGRAGYVVLLCDAGGVVVEHRGNVAEARELMCWGIWLGAVWSECVEGTNGIGTSLSEQRPVTIHQHQHFRARYTNLSCSGAPIFSPSGDLMAVLDVSSIDPTLSEQAHALTGPLTEATARAIEERCFRESFRKQWIVAVAPPGGTRIPMLFAVDRDLRIVGANRNARTLLVRNNFCVDKGVGFWQLFEQDAQAFSRQKDLSDVAARLTPFGTDAPWPALITRPAPGLHDPACARFFTRPRNVPSRTTLTGGHTRIGICPHAHRRALEYVETNLKEPIELRDLAGVARLSLFHFARAFKNAEGVTPHAYIVRRRVERAKELLRDGKLSIAEIALATGFSDQSHLARQFRAVVGQTPGTFRRLSQ